MTRRLPAGLLVAALALIAAASLGRPTAAHAAQVSPDWAHWGNRTVYVVNHAGSGWPVASATWEWNHGGVAHFVRVPDCTGTGCIVISRGGCTQPNYDAYTAVVMGRGHYLAAANISLCNRALGYGYAKRREIVMHELGHALGLNHDTWRGSVMWPYSHPQLAPTAYDYRLVARLYAGVPL